MAVIECLHCGAPVPVRDPSTDETAESSDPRPNGRAGVPRDNALRYVMLENGKYHGQLALAPPAPGSLRLGFAKNGEKRTALYRYAEGMTQPHPDHGELPVMLYMGENTFER